MRKHEDKTLASLARAISAMEKSIGTPAWQEAQDRQARLQRKAEAQTRKLQAKAAKQQRKAEAARRKADRRHR